MKRNLRDRKKKGHPYVTSITHNILCIAYRYFSCLTTASVQNWIIKKCLLIIYLTNDGSESCTEMPKVRLLFARILSALYVYVPYFIHQSKR
jgi:hypothetical protein